MVVRRPALSMLAIRLPCFAAALVVALIGTVSAAAETRPFSVHDLVMMDRISDPRLSPDGNHLAFVVRETSLQENKGLTSIWLLDLRSGEAARRMSEESASESAPRWSPDGKSLYFLSSRTETQQVWRVATGLSHVQQVTKLPIDVGDFLVSPRGDYLALLLEVFPDCPDLECTAKRLEENEERPASGRLYERLFVRHWDHWKDGTRAQLYSQRLNPSGTGSSEINRLSAPLDADVPSKPFGGSEEITFTKDGEHLIFSARLSGKSEAWSTNFDLYKVAVAGGEPENLTADNRAWDTMPATSPDGRWLAYLAMSRAGFEADRFQIKLRDLRTGKTRDVAGEWDRSAGALAFSPDSKALYTTTNHLGQRPLWKIGLADDEPRTISPEGYVSAFAVGEEQIIFALDTLASPAQLYSVIPKGRSPRAITDFNRERLQSVQMGDYEQFTFAGWNSEKTYAHVMKPAGFRRGEKYPVAFLIHGGPQGSFGNHFHYRWNPQTYAGAGFAVVFIDFHGSTGYGQAFTDSITGDWGGKPLEDLQKGLAAALEKYSWLDGERVCALGASYGGYMVNWIAGKWSDRFRCLVNHDGIFDNRMMYYATEELWFPEWEHGGAYHDNPEGFEKHNPANHVKRWKTPMLVIHGALDYRVPETQSLATYTALQRLGIPSRLLHFPNENHWVLKPANSILWHDTVNAWLAEWLRSPN